MISFILLEDTCIKLTNIINALWDDLFRNDNEITDFRFVKQFDFSNFCDLHSIENYYYNLIKKVCNALERKKDSKQTNLVSELQKYIKEHYYEDISLEEIAREVFFMNFCYLSRIFKAETGDTFSNALLKIRMEKAKKLLMEKDIPITQVAALTGYNNTAYFAKIFKKYYGKTPGDYKKKYIKIFYMDMTFMQYKHFSMIKGVGLLLVGWICGSQICQQKYLVETAENLMEIKIIFNLDNCNAGSVGLKLRGINEEEKVLAYNLDNQKLTLDCSKCGKEKDGIRNTVLEKNHQLSLHVFLDRSSIEVFVNNGQATMSSRIYPREERLGIELFTDDGSVEVEEFTYWILEDVWE